jgi:hypothetical protein
VCSLVGLVCLPKPTSFFFFFFFFFFFLPLSSSPLVFCIFLARNQVQSLAAHSFYTITAVFVLFTFFFFFLFFLFFPSFSFASAHTSPMVVICTIPLNKCFEIEGLCPLFLSTFFSLAASLFFALFHCLLMYLRPCFY